MEVEDVIDLSASGRGARAGGDTSENALHTHHVKNAAILIKAESRIIQLESEVSRLRHEAMADKLKQDLKFITKDLLVTDV